MADKFRCRWIIHPSETSAFTCLPSTHGHVIERYRLFPSSPLLQPQAPPSSLRYSPVMSTRISGQSYINEDLPGFGSFRCHENCAGNPAVVRESVLYATQAAVDGMRYKELACTTALRSSIP